MHTLARIIHLATPATYRFQNSGAKYIQSSNINNKNKILWHFQNPFVSVLAICGGKKTVEDSQQKPTTLAMWIWLYSAFCQEEL